MSHNELVGRGWSFPVVPGANGSIALSAGYFDIDEAITLILGTSIGERVMRPNFGCRIHELVFDPVNGETLGLAKRYVAEALGWWEPRIDVLAITVTAGPEPGRPRQTLDRYNLPCPGNKRRTVARVPVLSHPGGMTRAASPVESAPPRC